MYITTSRKKFLIKFAIGVVLSLPVAALAFLSFVVAAFLATPIYLAARAAGALLDEDPFGWTMNFWEDAFEAWRGL